MMQLRKQSSRMCGESDQEYCERLAIEKHVSDIADEEFLMESRHKKIGDIVISVCFSIFFGLPLAMIFIWCFVKLWIFILGGG